MKKIFFSLLLPFIANAQSDSLSIQNTDKALQLIQLCRQKVVSGQSTMADVAKRYSEDRVSAEKGGLILNVTRGTMVPEFENVAFRLKAGEISQIFETQFGYHFIQLLERNGEAVNLRHILIMPR